MARRQRRALHIEPAIVSAFSRYRERGRDRAQSEFRSREHPNRSPQPRTFLTCTVTDPSPVPTPVGPAADEQDPSHERNRRYGIREGAFQAVAQGGGENYLSAFALFLHATPVQIGILSSLPQLIGTWAQLVSVKALNHVAHRKPLILLGAAGQAALWLPILILPLLSPWAAPWLLIAVATVQVRWGTSPFPPGTA